MRILITAGLGLLLAATAPTGPPARTADRSSDLAMPAASIRAPEAPRTTVDTAEPRITGRTIRVPSGGSLQNAIDEARPGDLVALAPGATYRGPFRLPRKDGDGWIVIASETPPPAGRRVQPRLASRMPKLVASADSVVIADPGAHHYRLVGLEIMPAAGVFLRHELVRFGEDETDANALPHHLIVDRCYLHGDPQVGARRGVGLNSRTSAVVDSYLSDFKEVGNDSQAIAGWNGEGPFRIANNYLEGAGENVMFGGADPTIPGLVPADIEIVRNHLAKPLGWKIGDPAYQGTAWAVKNLFELKNARRALVDGNLLEYNWPHAQNGFAILFTPRNQKGGAPWSTVEDVTFVNNVLRHAGAGVNVLGRDDIHPSEPVRRIAIRNNLFEDIGGAWGNGRLFQLLDGTGDITIDHNTAFQAGSILFGGDHAPHTGFVFQNNIALENQHGIIGSGTEAGIPTIARYFPGAVVRRNVIVGGSAARYPSDNFFATSVEEAGRRYAKRATDGGDPGADLDALRNVANEAASGKQPPSAQSTQRMELFSGISGLGGLRGCFWASFALLVYIYFGYPLLARVRAAVRPKTRRRAPIEPAVTIVVVAHNEEDRIGARIENLLAHTYPRDRLDIVIASDGSSDGTVEAARRHARDGVVVRPFFTRRGKAAVLNEVVPSARGQIVVLADARQAFEPGAVRALVENFADPTVGAVSGELIIRTDETTSAAGAGTAFYWRYEKFIRSTESRGGSTVGATGAIYAIRRALFQPIPADTILDDVLIPMRVVRQGYSVMFEPRARAYDAAAATARHEFARKVRTISGTFQLFARERWLLNPFDNRLWFETISHKALRLTIPVLLAALFGANIALAQDPQEPLFRWLLAGQLLFCAAALSAAAAQTWGPASAGPTRLPLLSIPYAIALLSVATVVGWYRFVTNRQLVTWERLAPSSSPPRSPAPLGSTPGVPS